MLHEQQLVAVDNNARMHVFAQLAHVKYLPILPDEANLELFNALLTLTPEALKRPRR